MKDKNTEFQGQRELYKGHSLRPAYNNHSTNIFKNKARVILFYYTYLFVGVGPLVPHYGS